MPLTAEDVKNKQFTPTRFKGGYDEKEVDDFLDEVEAELTRLHRENTDLRARLQVAEQSRPAGAVPQQAAPPEAPAFTPPPAPVAAVPPPPPPAPPAPVVPVAPVVAASGEATQESALRMLAMAQRTADDTISDARREADKVLVDARMKADQLERETTERHRSVIGNLDSEREKLERKIEELRSFEREYRARLKSYLEGQLRDLDGRADGVQPTAPRPVAAAPSAPPASAPSSMTIPPSAPPRPPAPLGQPVGQPASAPPAFSTTPSAAPSGIQQPPRPPSPFSPVAAPPVPGTPPQGSPEPGPSGPPRQAPGGGFEVDEGPEPPPANG
jgi:DivIVA domain-containing protein